VSSFHDTGVYNFSIGILAPMSALFTASRVLDFVCDFRPSATGYF